MKKLICEYCGRLMIEGERCKKGLCNKHYRQLKKYGKFLDNDQRTKYDIAREKEEENLNKIFGNWLLLSKPFKKDKKAFVKAKCLLCNNEYEVSYNDVINGKSTKCKICGGCDRKYINEYRDINENESLLIIKNKEEKYEFIFNKKFKDKISNYYWSVIKEGDRVYARCSEKIARLHRLLCELEYGREEIENKIIDHINRNTFDNRLSNLNIVTPLENTQNAKIRKDNTSGVKGVNWCESFGKWHSRIQFNNKRIGKYFDSFEEAVKWRKEMEKEHHRYVQKINNNNKE